MTNTLIAVRGKADSGKTATLNRVHDILIERYPGCEFRRWHRKYEVKAILDIKGVRVGIASQGDQPQQLDECFEEFIALDCRLIVCATRSFRRSSDPVEEYGASGWKVVYVDKGREPEESKHGPATEEAAVRTVNTIECEITKITADEKFILSR